ncbi:hypothetical protein ACS0TY_023056 [Phlomoides rotata]
MAEAVLSAAVERIFALLEEQAVYHVNLVRGAEEEVRKLGQELNTIRNVLEDAENRRFQDKSINTWLWKLRHTSYGMEDILDEWEYALLKLHNAPPKEKVCSFILSSSCLCFKKVVARHKISKKILNVKARLDEILKEAKIYGFKIYEPTAYPLPEFGRDQSTSFINTEEVQGRGRDGETLVDKLMGNGGSQEESGIQVLSIVGVGGLGKTTLAQLVYNHNRVKGSFDPRIWICVSNSFHQAAIAKGILESIGEGSSQGADQLDVLLKRVNERIKGKKFLLVLDDVWTEDPRNWKFLRNCLGCGGAGSKILVTTRSERVAETMGISEIFRPEMLSNDDCWLVLYHTACLEWNEVETFVDIGKKIAKKCSGLPLAATTLGGILCFKKSLREWENVLNDEIWEMQEAEDGIFRPLLMSYKELSPTQKQCFSYCAAFPKDYEIEVESLIGNWMALGYLGSNSDDMELKGKECFDVLAKRSLFQDFNKDDGWDEIKSCKMHDIVHDFAQYLRKSGREKAGGVEVAAEMNKTQVSNVNEFCTLYYDGYYPPNFCNRVVRLRVLSLARCCLQGVPHEMDKLIHLRWLDLSGKKLSTEDLKFIFQLYFLQTLYLCDCSLEEIPNEIGNLSHLRHLNLSLNRLKELPSEIGNLKQLRHLNLDGNKDLKELPSEIGKLSFLQTLKLSDCSLEEIPSEIGNLKQLRHLDLDDNDDLKELPSEIWKLSFLQTFILPEWATIQIPEALAHLTGLRKLKGFKGGSGWRKLRLLKNLNHLGFVSLRIILDGMDLKGIVEDSREANFSNKKYIEDLELKFMDEMGEEGSSRMDVIDALKPHPNLRMLSIWRYKGSKLPLWIVSPANQLKKVALYNCDRLTSLPSFGELPCLEELVVNAAKVLEFVGREFLGITTNTNFVAFPKLKELRFVNCGKWKEWEDITAEEEESPAFQVMPCLTMLKIEFCRGLTALPHRHLRKASSLEILNIPLSYGLERYKNKEGTDWKSISLNNPRLQLQTDRYS